MTIVEYHSGDFTASGWTKAFGSRLAKQLAGDVPKGTKFAVATLRATPQVLVLKLSILDKNFVVKAFNPSLDISADAFTREMQLLRLIKETGLAPKLSAYSPENCFLVMDWGGSNTVANAINNENVVEIAAKLGAWLASFDAVSPSRAYKGNWDAYLQKVGSHGLSSLPQDTRALLSKFEITQQKIAKNDAHLANFLIAPRGEIVGIDFESATFKPRGWDILVTARSLARSFPTRTNTIVSEIVSGWGQGTELMEPTDFRQLVEIFVQTSTYNKT